MSQKKVKINEMTFIDKNEPIKSKLAREKLVTDLKNIKAPNKMIQNAMDGDYGDYKNNKYEFPLSVLAKKLLDLGTKGSIELYKKTMDGEYDGPI